MALPSAYQQVEYLKGTGTQYLDTGLKLKTTDIVECDFSDYTISTGANTQTKLFGCYGYTDSTLNRASVWFGNNSASNTNLSYYNNLKAVNCSGVSHPYTGLLVINQNTASLNGVVIGTLSGTIEEVECFHTALLFAAYVKTSSSVEVFPSEVKIRRYTVKTNTGILKQNLIPCYRKSDLVAGMYDTVNNQFYANAGTGTFTIGGAIYTGSGNGGKTLVGATAYGMKGGKPLINNAAYKILYGKNNVNGTNYKISFPRLPSELQEVQYIQSSGTQYIDSGFIPNSTSKCEGRVSGLYSGIDGMIFGSYTTGANEWGLINSAYYPTFRFDYGNSEPVINLPLNANTLYNFSSNANVCVINGNTLTAAAKTFSGDKPVFIFARNQNGSPGVYHPCAKLHYLKFWTNANTLARDFVPCYRKADNVAGLYDLVNHVFYTNKGTGSFTVGPNV